MRSTPNNYVTDVPTGETARASCADEGQANVMKGSRLVAEAAGVEAYILHCFSNVVHGPNRESDQ